MNLSMKENRIIIGPKDCVREVREKKEDDIV